jgi:hypothetical protein
MDAECRFHSVVPSVSNMWVSPVPSQNIACTCCQSVAQSRNMRSHMVHHTSTDLAPTSSCPMQNAASITTITYLLIRLGHSICFLRVLGSLHDAIVGLSFSQSRKATRRLALGKKSAVVIHQHERIVLWIGDPHQLEGNSGAKLNMSYIPWWIAVAPHGTRGPGTTGTEFRKGCQSNPCSKWVSVGNSSNLVI